MTQAGNAAYLAMPCVWVLDWVGLGVFFFVCRAAVYARAEFVNLNGVWQQPPLHPHTRPAARHELITLMGFAAAAAVATDAPCLWPVSFFFSLFNANEIFVRYALYLH